MQKSVVVTGAGGYIGRHVVSALLDRGLSVAAVDLRLDGVDARAERLDIYLFSGDANIYSQMGRPDAVLHMAWRDGFRHGSPAHLDDLARHYHLVENLYAGGLHQLAVMGTMHEVGYWEGAIDENSRCAPASLYGIAKNALREATRLSAAAHDAVFQWIRAYYIVGDDKFGNSIFSKLLAAAEEGRSTFPFTTGKNKYDFISVDELATQIAAIVDQDAVTGIINAATGKQLDDATAQVAVLQRQIAAQRSTLRTSTDGIDKEAHALAVQVEQMDDRLRRCHIVNPTRGTVMTRYVRAKEMTAPGQPLYRIADLSQMTLRVYITGDQLSQVRLGQRVNVFSDSGDPHKPMHRDEGVIFWISDRAEFTPKTIRTRDERADLVYAVKVRVQNPEGRYKMGMYGEITFQ